MSAANSAKTPAAVGSPVTVVEALDRLATERRHGFHFVGLGRQERFISNCEIREEAFRRAAHLSALGLGKGDRVALVIADGAEFVLSLFGAIAAGIVPVPISPSATAKSLDAYVNTVAAIVRRANAKMLLTTAATEFLLRPVQAQINRTTNVVTTEAAFSGLVPDFQPPSVSPDDLCFLQFTSGSTSAPRGVEVSHANLIANVNAFLGPEGFGRYPDDIGVSWLPLHHDMGLIGFVMGPVIQNGPVVIISTSAFVRDPRIWLRAVHEYRGTITYAPNFGYALTTRRLRDNDIQALDLSCVRVAGCGAEPIHFRTLQKFAERLAPTGFRPEAFLPSYGLAESTLAVTLHKTGEPLRVEHTDLESRKRGNGASRNGEENNFEIVSCGFPFADHELQIVGKDGAILPEREVGEIVIRGPSVARGYFDDRKATEASWRNGWLHTGDLGYIADGELFVCGRIKDLIIVRGANFYAHDIENAVRDLPSVRRGNVIAFGVSGNGEDRLVLAAETDAREATGLRESITARVCENFGIVTHDVLLVAAGVLPKTSSGKPRRQQTKELYLTGQLKDIATCQLRQT
ncbi:MAG: fatty acyl-AMP ligase [Acidobacteriota bacterium]